MSRRLLAALAVLASVVVTPAATATGCAGVHPGKRWTRIEYPADYDLHDFIAIPPARRGGADTLLLEGMDTSAGLNRARKILRSGDGGCSWSVAYTMTVTPETAAALASPTVGIDSMTAAGSVVYAVTAETVIGIATPPPVATIVSKDGGATWTAHVPSDLSKDVPRCTGTTVSAGTDPATAYLWCSNGFSIGDTALLAFRCRYSVYVTHDYAATWTPLAPGLTDLSKARADASAVSGQYGCGPAGQGTATTADPYVPGVLWEVQHAPDNSVKKVARSADGGRTWSPYGSLTPDSVWALQETTRGDGVPVLLEDAYTSWSVSYGGGRWKAVPELRLPAAQKVPVGAGSLRLLDRTATVLMVYVDGKRTARAFTYDVVKGGSWRELPAPPSVGGKPAWYNTFPKVASNPALGGFYVASYNDGVGIWRYRP